MVLSLMLTIIDEDQTEKITRFLRDHLARYQYVSPAFGTANSELTALLGLGETSKSIVISLVPKHQAEILTRDMPEHIKLGKRTKGLVITVPLTGVSNSLFGSFNPGFLLKLYEELDPDCHSHILKMLNIEPGELTAELLSERMLQMEQEAEKAQIQEDVVRHDLIVAVVGRDTSEELMEAAKTAGARGGTVINARRVGLDEDGTFMGMPIQVNKEIILIMTDRKNKLAIMKAVNHSFGLNTPAHGLIFSIPVDSVAWIE